MEIPAFTPRNVAKYAVKFAIAGVVARRVETAIEDHTRYEKDNMLVELTGNVVGWYVSDKLQPVTDKIVDKTADFIVAQREKREARRNDTTEK